MPHMESLPDEIVQHLLQCIHNTGEEDFMFRETAFLNLVTVFPRWIPILLDARFVNDAGQLGPRYEDVWGYRHRVYLEEESGLWKIRDQKWQPQGVKINAWKTRNGECSHVEVKEEEEAISSKRGLDGSCKAEAQAKGTRTEVQQQADPESDLAYDEESEQSSVSSFEGWVLNQI